MTPIYYRPEQDCSYHFISLAKIPEFVKQSGRAPCTDFEPFERGDLLAAHSDKYVDGVLAGATFNGFGNTSPEVNRSLLYSTASMNAATFHALSSGVACSASQGFHHAGWAYGGGYCTFNGLVIAAQRVLEYVPSVLIIDGDAHYGDGTDDCLDALGGDRIKNITRGSQIGRNIQGAWNDEMWEAWARDLIRASRPGIILYQAGADAWEEDPYQCGYLTKDGLYHRDLGVFRAAKKASIPIAWNLAGGYTEPMQKVIDIHLQTLRASDEVFYGSAR